MKTSQSDSSPSCGPVPAVITSTPAVIDGPAAIESKTDWMPQYVLACSVQIHFRLISARYCKNAGREKTGIYPGPGKHPIRQILRKPSWVEDYSMWDTMMCWFNLSLWKICTKWRLFDFFPPLSFILSLFPIGYQSRKEKASSKEAHETSWCHLFSWLILQHQ